MWLRRSCRPRRYACWSPPRGVTPCLIGKCFGVVLRQKRLLSVEERITVTARVVESVVEGLDKVATVQEKVIQLL